MFEFQDGQCINKENYCDNIPHCKDQSDERNCCHNGFQCPQTEVCLSLSLTCDGNENCADGSDEKDCAAVRNSGKSITHTIIICVTAGVVIVVVFFIVVLRKRFLLKEDVNDQSEESLNPMHPKAWKSPKLRKG